MKIGSLIRMCTYLFVGYILARMGYGLSNWEFWAILFSIAIVQISEFWEN